jgi:DNA-binding NtrC family response regulator
MVEGPDGSVSKTVLIVDDDALMAVMMSQAFAEEGYEPLVAQNADKALEVLAVAAQRIQLIVTDIMMPGSMDGLELGHLVAERFAHIPVITMTGYSTEGRQEAVGPTLQKPFAIEHLMLVARRIIENGRFWRQMMKLPRS